MPSGVRLKDGHPTFITFSGAPNIGFWIVTIKPPGLSARGPNNTTTMHNVTVTTQQPKKLKTMTNSTGTAQYDPAVLNDLLAQVGVNQLLTLTFPDGKKWEFWGWLDMFDPQEITEGSPPLADFTVEPANENLSGVETLPTYVAA